MCGHWEGTATGPPRPSGRAQSSRPGSACQQCQLFAYPIHFRRQLSRPLPLALVLAVPGKDVLLALNEIIGGNRLGGGAGKEGRRPGKESHPNEEEKELSMSVKITQFEAENVKRIKALTLTPAPAGPWL